MKKMNLFEGSRAEKGYRKAVMYNACQIHETPKMLT